MREGRVVNRHGNCGLGLIKPSVKLLPLHHRVRDFFRFGLTLKFFRVAADVRVHFIVRDRELVSKKLLDVHAGQSAVFGVCFCGAGRRRSHAARNSDHHDANPDAHKQRGRRGASRVARHRRPSAARAH